MRACLSSCAILSLLATTANAQRLTIGAEAPALHIARWLKGEPVESFVSGRVYVVEFWATWSGPCIACMPHLTRLQTQWKGKGVTIVAVTTEDPNNSLPAVETMVTDKADGMGYTVAWDDGHETYAAYMQAAQQTGVPCAFVIDGQGKIAYIGHPMLVEMPVAGLVDGTWDPTTGPRRLEDAQKRLGQISREIVADTEESNARVAAFVAEFPLLADQVRSLEFRLLLQAKRFDRAFAVGARLADKAAAAKDPTTLNEIAWSIADPAAELERRDLDLALRAASRAAELTKGKDANILDTLARVWFWKRDYEKALELQKKAASLCTDPALGRTVAEYEKLVAEATDKGRAPKGKDR